MADGMNFDFSGMSAAFGGGNTPALPDMSGMGSSASPFASMGSGSAGGGMMQDLSSAMGGTVLGGIAGLFGSKHRAKQMQQSGRDMAQMAMPFMQHYQHFGDQLARGADSGQFGANANAGFVNPLQAYAQNTAGQANPLQGIGQQYNQMLTNPSSFFSSPMYQAAFGQGQNALNATLAAQGLNGSGAQLQELQKYGQSFALNELNQYQSQLGAGLDRQQGINQQGFGQLSSAANTGITNNAQQFRQLSDLSGLSGSNPGLAASAIQGGNAAAAQEGQRAGNVLGGLEKTAMSALPMMFSDRRLKTDIQKIGSLDNGLNVYSYHYLWDDEDSELHVGVMAQEAEKIVPESVVTNQYGYKMVDYSKINRIAA